MTGKQLRERCENLCDEYKGLFLPGTHTVAARKLESLCRDIIEECARVAEGEFLMDIIPEETKKEFSTRLATSIASHIRTLKESK